MEDIIKAIYYKAGKQTGKPDNKTAMSDYLSEWFSATGNGPIGSKTLLRQYDRYVLKLENAQQNAAPSTNHLNAYAVFLDYLNYDDYILKTSKNHFGGEQSGSASTPERVTVGTAIKEQINIKKQKIEHVGTKIKNQTINNIGESEESEKRNKKILFIVLFIAAVVSITLWIVFSKNGEKLCLVWKVNRFESAECSSISESESSISVNPNEWGDKYKNFRKIEVTQSTTFFDKSGKPVVWYSKRNGNYNFFNEPGHHPLTGKKLQPINQSVIEDYFKVPKERIDDSNNSNPFTEPEKTSDVDHQSELLSGQQENAVKKGKYCFKNQSNKNIRVSVNSSSQPTQSLNLNPNEQICIQLPLEKYSYEAFISGQSSAFKRGVFFVSENREGSISLSIPEEKTATIQPETKPAVQPVETKPAKDLSKGDFCIKNTTNKKLDVRVGNKTDGPLGSNYYFFLTISPGQTECYYDIPAVAYYLQYYFNDEMQHLKYSQIRVKGGETGEKVF